MAAACAVCLAPIGRGEKFVLVGTEVIHPYCVVGHTKSTKQRLHIIDLEHEISQMRIELEESGRRAAQAVKDMNRMVQDEARDYERLRDRLEAEMARVEAYRRDRDEARVQRDQSRAELEQVRRELVVARMTPVVAPAPAATVVTSAGSTSEPAKDDRDASEIRFSLLDLD